MTRRGWLLVLGFGIVAALLLVGGSAYAFKRLTASTKAKQLGISNEPTNARDRRRLEWLATVLPSFEAVLKEHNPRVRLTSAYRNDAVNAAVDGSPTSRHRLGLAFDFSDGATVDYTSLAQHLRDNIGRVKAAPRAVLVEHNPPHLHLDFYDPLGELDAGHGPTAFRIERDGRATGEARKTNALT